MNFKTEEHVISMPHFIEGVPITKDKYLKENKEFKK